MGTRGKSLSITDRAALDVINKFPGLTPLEIGGHLQGIIKPTSASSIVSHLTHLRKVNRVKVPHTPTFRYYPLDHPLPKGSKQWDNELVEVAKRGPEKPSVQAMNNVHVQAAVAKAPKQEPAPPKDERQLGDSLQQMKLPLESVSVLITIEYGRNQSLTVSVDDAKHIWRQLNVVFAK